MLNLRHSWPKFLTLITALFFLPKTREAILPFLFLGLASTMILHHLIPYKVVVPLTLVDWAVIILNLSLTAINAFAFFHHSGDKVTEVGALLDIPAYQFLYVPVWILIEELSFFTLHQIAHHPKVYGSPFYSHKMHHKVSFKKIFDGLPRSGNQSLLKVKVNSVCSLLI